MTYAIANVSQDKAEAMLTLVEGVSSDQLKDGVSLLDEMDKLIAVVRPREAMMLMQRKCALKERLNFIVAHSVKMEKPISQFKPDMEVQKLLKRVSAFISH